MLNKLIPIREIYSWIGISFRVCSEYVTKNGIMADKPVFPINKLNQRVTEKLSRIITADILGNINMGLRNELNLIDEGESVTDSARVDKNPLTGETYVTISAAFMQYVWLLTDIALKNIDMAIIQREFTRCGVDYRLYPLIVDTILSMPKEDVIKLNNLPVGFDIEQYYEYLRRSKSLFDVTAQEQKISQSIMLLARLATKGEKFTESDFDVIELNGEYEVVVNGAYCYAIAFAMLHELSHFALGHLDMTPVEQLNETEEEKKRDESNADLAAFWAVFCDLQGRDQFTAVIGLFSLMFALLMLNPTMVEDHEHPREDQRIFDIYDQVKDENPKYTVLLVRMFCMWARVVNVSEFPQVTDDSENSLNQIREFLKGWKSQEAV